MAVEENLTTNNVRGFISLHRIDNATGRRIKICEQSNQIQYTWGYVAAKALGLRPESGQANYNISAVYFEFENVISAETAVVEPQTFLRSVGLPYYDGLGAMFNRDYLRIPMVVAPQFSTSSGYASLLPTEQQTNQLTFFAQTEGTSGINGKGFGSNVSGKISKIYAASLVAAPDIDDPTKDIVFARTVFNTENQVLKDASSQIGITWTIAFT